MWVREVSDELRIKQRYRCLTNEGLGGHFARRFGALEFHHHEVAFAADAQDVDVGRGWPTPRRDLPANEQKRRLIHDGEVLLDGVFEMLFQVGRAEDHAFWLLRRAREVASSIGRSVQRVASSFASSVADRGGKPATKAPRSDAVPFDAEEAALELNPPEDAAPKFELSPECRTLRRQFFAVSHKTGLIMRREVHVARVAAIAGFIGRPLISASEMTQEK